jgi:hypothetical protein
MKPKELSIVMLHHRLELHGEVRRFGGFSNEWKNKKEAKKAGIHHHLF